MKREQGKEEKEKDEEWGNMQRIKKENIKKTRMRRGLRERRDNEGFKRGWCNTEHGQEM